MFSLKFCLCLLVLSITGGNSAKKDYDKKDTEMIAKLEKSFLSAFGMDARPDGDKKQVKVHPYMYQLYNMNVKQNLAESEEDVEREMKSRAPFKHSYVLANTVRSFTHSESPEDRFHPSHKMLFHFNVTSVPKSEILRGGELRIVHIRHPSIPLGSTGPGRSDSKTKRRRWSKEEIVYSSRIYVYDVIRPSRGSLEPIHRLLDTRVIDARANGTAVFDIAPAIKRWISKPHTNHGIFVEILPLKKNVSLFIDGSHLRLRRDVESEISSDEWLEQNPILVVYTDDQKLKPREKRSTSTSAYKRPHCRRYNLYVDFGKIGWTNWIFAPLGYDAYFCQGECPYPLAKHMNATNHAVIQNIIHSRYPSKVPSPCCVPIKQSAISILYLDSDKKVVLRTYQDMIVESCGCQ